MMGIRLMRLPYYPLAILVLALCLSRVAVGSEVILVVDGVTPGAGMVMVGVYERRAASGGAPVHSENLEPEAALLKETVAGLEAGRYAVAAYQDRNGSGSLDRNFLGVPSEPYGFSHGARGTMGPPAFDDAMFRLGAEPVEIHVPLE